jgi:hypothetical protein
MKIKKAQPVAAVERPEWLALLDGDIEVRALVESLAFDPDMVERAGAEQAKLYYDASRYHLKIWRQLASLQAKLDLAKAEAGLRIRSRTKEGRGPSIPEVADLVSLDKIVRKLSEKIRVVTAHEKYADLLVKSYMARQSALKVVSETRNAEINGAVRQVKARMASDGMREKMESLRARSGHEEDIPY